MPAEAGGQIGFDLVPRNSLTRVFFEFREAVVKISNLGSGNVFIGHLKDERRLLARVSGEDDLGIPELAIDQDLAILEAISHSSPRLCAKEGWTVASNLHECR